MADDAPVQAAPEEQPVVQTAPQAQPEREPASAPAQPQDAPGALQEASTRQQAPVSGGLPALHSGETEAGIAPSKWGEFVNSLKQTSAASPIGFMPDEPGTLQRMYVQHEQEVQDRSNGVGKITPQQATAMFPGMPTPFTTDVDPYVAQLQYDDFQHRQKLQDWAQRGDAAFGSSFIAGVAGGFADPLNAALGIATGGAASLLGGAEKAVGLAAARNVFLQNLAVNVATGVPSYYQEKAEHQETSVVGAGIQAVEGAVGGTLFHYGVQGAAKAFSAAAGKVADGLGAAMEFLRRTPEDVQTKTLRTAVAQTEAGAPVDTSLGVEWAKARMSGEASPATFTPQGHPSESNYYMAKNADGKSVEFHNLGKGSYAVDNPSVANSMVSGTEGGEPGQIGEMRPEADKNYLNIEEPAASPDNEKFVGALEEKIGQDIKIEPNESIKDLLTRLDQEAGQGSKLPPDVLDQAQDVAKDQGYAGYKYVESNAQGQPTHNGLLDFRENASPSNAMQANSDVAPKLDPAQEKNFLDQTTSAKASSTYSPEEAKNIKDARQAPSFNSTPDYMDPIVKDQYDMARSQLEEMVKKDPTLKPELDAMKRQEATMKQEKQALSDFADCVAGSVV